MAIKYLSSVDILVTSSILKTDANGVIVAAVAGTDYLSSINSSMITTALGYTPVPTTRTLTINGTTYDLSANRSWTVSTVETDTLATVTTRGNVTTNTIDVGGVKSDYVTLDTTATPTPVTGMFSWNTADDTANLQLASGASLQLGQEQHWYVKNSTGSTITNGTVVMAVGTDGASGHILVAPMIADGSVEERYVLGIATTAITNGGFGHVTSFGKVRGLNTTAFSDGAVLYCDPAAPGGLTDVQPIAPNLNIPLAFVVSSAVNGMLAVRVNPGYHLGELHDVYQSSATTGQLLRYNSNRWENWTPNYLTSINSSMVTTALGYTPVTNARTLTINGTAFDLSANRSWTISTITGNAGSATVLQTARTLTIGNTGKSFNGSANVSWSLAEIGALPLTGGNLTGTTSLNGGVSLMFNGAADTNWRIGRNIITETGNQLTANTMQFIAADAAGEGWQFVDDNGVTRFEIGASTGNAWLPSGNLYLAGNLAATQAYVTSQGYTSNTGTVTSVSGVGGYGGLTLSGTVTTSGSLTLGGTPTGTWPIAVSGNAATATTLATARTLTIGATGKTFNGSANVSWSLAEIGALGATAKAADSELLDGLDSSSFLRSDAADTATGEILFDAGFKSDAILLNGAQNFDNISRSGFYNLYNTNTGSTNSPGFPYGTMLVVGSNKDGATFGFQLAHERLNTAGGFRVRGMNDTGSAWSSWATVWTSQDFANNSANWNTAYGWGNHASAGYAPLASPALTGTPTAPTATAGTNTTQIATTAFVQTAVSNLIDSAPATLDTLNELAAALGDDPNFATTVSNNIGTKVSKSGDTMTGNLSFGSATRQMINLWSTSYGIGVQSSTTYFRSDGRFSWFRGGVHSDSQNNAGTGGTVAMTLDSSSNLTVAGTLTASGYNKTNWDTAYGWGNHAGLYLGVSDTAVDSNKLGGLAASSYYLASNPNGYITSSSNITGTSAGVVRTVTGTTSAELVRGNMGDNDQARILVGATASNAGYLEIATADDGTEPIYVRQYTGVFSTLTRTATLLDASGNTSFPGTVTAPTFSGALSGNATTATTLATARTLTIGNTGKTFNGSANVSWSLAEIGAYAATNPAGYTTNTGTVTSVAGAGGYGGLTLSGTVTTSGSITLGGTPTGTWPISVSGNAATATTAGTWTTARTLTIGSTGKSVNGSANVSWSLAEIGAQPAGSYLTAEADTLATVTGRGNSTSSLVILSGKVSLGTSSTGTYNGNVTGLTINSTAEIRSTSAQNPPALTWHYEGLATRHLLMTSAGAMNFVSPSNEASGVAVLQVNGNTVWHEGNFTPSSYLPLSGGALTGNTSLNSGISLLFSGLADTNWRIGRNIVTESSNNLTSNTLQFIAAASAGQGWQFVGSTGVTRFEIDASNGATYLNGTQFDFTGSSIALRNNTEFSFLTRSNAAQQARFKGIQVSTSYSGTVPSNGILFFTDTKLSRTDVQELSTNSNFIPDADRTYNLGREDARWRTVYCETLDSAGLHESNLADKEISEQETGTVMSWQNGKMVPCSKFADHMRMGIAVKGNSSPLVQGAEPVLCTGNVAEGQYLVTSETIGHAVGVDRSYVVEHQLFDCVIGKALESGSGDSFIVKTWVNI